MSDMSVLRDHAHDVSAILARGTRADPRVEHHDEHPQPEWVRTLKEHAQPDPRDGVGSRGRCRASCIGDDDRGGASSRCHGIGGCGDVRDGSDGSHVVISNARSVKLSGDVRTEMEMQS